MRRELAPAAADAGLSLERLEPFVADVQSQKAAPVITLASLAGTALSAAVGAQLVPGRAGQPWTVLLNLHLPEAAPRAQAAGATAPASDAGSLRQALAGLPDTRLVLIQPELDSVYARYLHEGLWQALLGAAAVLALLLVHLRSWRRLLRVAVPLAASVVLVLAALSTAGMALGVLHLVGFLLVVAVGSNYALFFDHIAGSPGTEAATEAGIEEETLASLLLANLTTVTTFGLLASSSVPALFDIGVVVGPGTLLCLLLSAAFIGPRRSHRAQGLVGKLRL